MPLPDVTCQIGYLSFVFVCSRLSLDFVGTLKWLRDTSEELFDRPDAVGSGQRRQVSSTPLQPSMRGA